MNLPKARRLLICYIADPNVTPSPAVQKALKVAADSDILSSEYQAQVEIDKRVHASIKGPLILAWTLLSISTWA